MSINEPDNEDAFRKMLFAHRIGTDWDPIETPSEYSKWAAQVRAKWMMERGIKPRRPDGA